jgi:8-amino-7-oxononanoate synthase
MKLIAELERDLAARASEGLIRVRRRVDSAQGARTRSGGRDLITFASNDYLALASDPRVVTAARGAALQWGVGAGASHLLCGHFAPHDALERELAAFVRPCKGAEALLLSTGYLANLAILTALARRGDAIFSDRLNHACLNDGALLSRASLIRYAHGSVADLRRRVEATPATRRLIVTDAVFSMDGDIAPVAELLAIADELDAWLILDDAHGFGVLGDADNPGRGTLAHLGLESERIVYMGTLGKAAGCAGAFICAHPAVIQTILQTARPYIFTTAAPPLLAEATRASLAIIRCEHERQRRLHRLIARFRKRAQALPWTLLPSSTPIQPLVVGDNAATLELSNALWQRGLWVPAIRPPTVAAGTARLRVTLTAGHSEADVDVLTGALHELAHDLSLLAR